MTAAYDAVVAVRSLPITIAIAAFVDMIVGIGAPARTGSAIVTIHDSGTRWPVAVATLFYGDFAARTTIFVMSAAIRFSPGTRGPVTHHVTSLGLRNTAEGC
jgi:hypothetical protein